MKDYQENTPNQPFPPRRRQRYPQHYLDYKFPVAIENPVFEHIQNVINGYDGPTPLWIRELHEEMLKEECDW